MNLIIDIGNTRVKAALFSNKELEHSFIFDSTEEVLSFDLFAKYPINNCIVATVVNEIDTFIEALKKKTNVLLFTSSTPIPIKNHYQSAQTLGSDRLAAAVAGNYKFTNKNILIIDAGTCIKYNFVNSSNQYLGGGISPGLKMRLKAIHEFTSRLPLLELDEHFDTLIGTTTNESILSGVALGAVAEVDGIIDRYRLIYEDLTVVFTGGDFNFFAKRLKNSIFADQFLILYGLNVILDYNINAKT